MGRDQRVTREEALRLATIDNARLMFDEDRKGSIEPGKLADLVVLSENILTCPEPRIRDADVLMTMVGGEIVYERRSRETKSREWTFVARDFSPATKPGFAIGDAMKRRTLLQLFLSLVAALPARVRLFAQTPPLDRRRRSAHPRDCRRRAARRDRRGRARDGGRADSSPGCATTVPAPTPTTATASRGCGERRRRRRRSMPRSSTRSTSAPGQAGAPSRSSHASERRVAGRRSDRGREDRAPAGRPDGGHVATDLMAFYFNSIDANDLAYRARIGRDTCRGLEGSENRPAPLPTEAGDAALRMRRLHHRRRHLGGAARAEAVASCRRGTSIIVVEAGDRLFDTKKRWQDRARSLALRREPVARRRHRGSGGGGHHLADDGGRRIGAALGRRDATGSRKRTCGCKSLLRAGGGLADRVDRARALLLRGRAPYRRVRRAGPAARGSTLGAVSDGGDAAVVEPASS